MQRSVETTQKSGINTGNWKCNIPDITLKVKWRCLVSITRFFEIARWILHKKFTLAQIRRKMKVLKTIRRPLIAFPSIARWKSGCFIAPFQYPPPLAFPETYRGRWWSVKMKQHCFRLVGDIFEGCFELVHEREQILVFASWNIRQKLSSSAAIISNIPIQFEFLVPIQRYQPTIS